MSVDPMFAPSEVAKELGVDQDAIYEWIRTGELAATNMKRRKKNRWRIPRSSIEAFKVRRAYQPGEHGSSKVNFGQSRPTSATVQT